MQIDRSCPVCGTPSNQAKLFVAENINLEKTTGFIFSSRKTPEFMSHRMVHCPKCDLVYVPQPPAENELAAAYHLAEYDSFVEAEDAADVYVRAIQSILTELPQCKSALEIGTGTGVFLARLKRAGFSELIGVEPSLAAIDAASPEQRTWIQQGVFDGNSFEPSTFDLVCCFMTMEHVPDPATVARSVLKLLRPGGAFVTVTHDRRSAVNRLLGKRSPIIDLEHMQLFSGTSLTAMFELNGYERIKLEGFSNRYALRYWLRLTPVPGLVKSLISRGLDLTGCANFKLSINVGNTMGVGFKPL